MVKGRKKPAATRPGRKAKPPAVITSEGQRLLLAIDESLAQIAGAIRCNRTSVLDWRNGDKQPFPELRARLFNVYKIPIAAWDQMPASPEPAADPAAATSSTPTTLEDCLALQKLLRDARKKPGLRPADAIRLAGVEVRVIGQRQKLEYERDMLEDRIVREHPRWQALKGAILKVLAAHPAAAKAVAEVLAAQGM